MSEEITRRSAGVCEGNDVLRGTLRRALTQAGFTTTALAEGAEALTRFTQTPPDVLVVAVELPDADGRHLCRQLRARGIDAPVLFTSGDPDVHARRAALAAGGDDLLVKPFALAELLVRIGGLVQLPPPSGTWRDSSGRARLDPGTRSVAGAAGRADLTPTEFRILALLDDRRGELVARSELVAIGWPDGAVVSANTLDAYVARIRRKLRAAGAPEALRTRRGMGYELR